MRPTNELLELLYFLKSNAYVYVMRPGFIEIIVNNEIIHVNNKGVI